MTENQKTVLRKLTFAGQGRGTSCQGAGSILRNAGLIPNRKSSQGNYGLAGASVLYALERRGLALHINSSRDQWAIKIWFLTDLGAEEAAKYKATP